MGFEGNFIGTRVARTDISGRQESPAVAPEARGQQQILASFFNKIAHENGFHPVIESDRWHNLSLAEPHSLKVLQFLLS